MNNSDILQYKLTGRHYVDKHYVSRFKDINIEYYPIWSLYINKLNNLYVKYDSSYIGVKFLKKIDDFTTHGGTVALIKEIFIKTIKLNKHFSIIDVITKYNKYCEHNETNDNNIDKFIKHYINKIN